MRPRRLSELAHAVGGTLVGEDVTVSAVVVDSRVAEPGALFVAVRGEHADGHDFVGDAFARGAAAAVVAHRGRASGPAVVVEDTIEALGRVAAAERRDLSATVIGVTGSSGKTTTKDFVAAVLATQFQVQASAGSFNNELGLPLTILAASERTEALVCEMGARGLGHIADLCRIAAPNVGIVTNVGVAHMELFGTRDNIAQAKGELVESLPEDGTAILSADDPLVRAMSDRTDATVLTFGVSEQADVRAVGMQLSDRGLARFTLEHGGERTEAELAVPGEHMVQNALAAAAAGVVMGVPLSQAASALREARASSWRMETFVTSGGVVVINDAYNANPQSMAAALKTARWMARDARLAAVLGRMAELGPLTLEEHERVGELAARLRVERLITVGADARVISVAALREGVEPENVAAYDEPDEALEDVRGWAREGDVVLFKGSRVTGLERLAEAMR